MTSHSSHHTIPRHLKEYTKPVLVSRRQGDPADAGRNRDSVRRAFVAQARREKVGLSRATVPLEEIPAGKLPAVFFSRKGQHPVIIQGKNDEGFAVRLWDGEEMICRTEDLVKLVEREGYFLSGSGSPDWRRFGRHLWAARRQLFLGFAEGLVVISALTLLLSAIHFLTPAAEESGTSPVSLILGIFASVLTIFGFFQLRGPLNLVFSRLASSSRVESASPAFHPVRRATSPDSGREIVEVSGAIYLALASILVISFLSGTAAGWITGLSGLAASAVLIAQFPGLADRWRQAIWILSDTSSEERAPSMTRPSLIRAHNISLRHPEESHPPLLRNISLRIARGEKVAIQSRMPLEPHLLFQVITGRIRPDSGAVWMDGEPVTEDRSAAIGCFSERATFLEGSLRDNLCLGRNFTDREIQRAARATGLIDCEMFQDRILDAGISESGKELSSLDRMRLQLSRILLHRPSLLVVEVPRDLELETCFFEVLLTYMKQNECTVLIGGRSTSQFGFTDRTIVLDQGKVVTEGPTERILSMLKARSIYHSVARG